MTQIKDIVPVELINRAGAVPAVKTKLWGLRSSLVRRRCCFITALTATWPISSYRS